MADVSKSVCECVFDPVLAGKTDRLIIYHGPVMSGSLIMGLYIHFGVYLGK